MGVPMKMHMPVYIGPKVPFVQFMSPWIMVLRCGGQPTPALAYAPRISDLDWKSNYQLDQMRFDASRCHFPVPLPKYLCYSPHYRPCKMPLVFHLFSIIVGSSSVNPQGA
jgi:hypothetical protein